MTDDCWKMGATMLMLISVPEVQGSTQEVAIAKCKAAAEQVSLGSDHMHDHLTDSLEQRALRKTLHFALKR
jgi:hypothetical protein